MGLREYGRLERTLFTLKWLRDPALRRRVTGGLNKGEARNALARTVFFHRLGEIRDRSYENQRPFSMMASRLVTCNQSGQPDRRKNVHGECALSAANS
jgi:TnpA family transposase